MNVHTIGDNETHKLASLARMSLTETEHVMFKKDIESILGFIDTIQDISSKDIPMQQTGFAPINGVRSDVALSVCDPVEAQQIIAQSPKSTDNYIQVKKILNQ